MKARQSFSSVSFVLLSLVVLFNSNRWSLLADSPPEPTLYNASQPTSTPTSVGHAPQPQPPNTNASTSTPTLSVGPAPQPSPPSSPSPSPSPSPSFSVGPSPQPQPSPSPSPIPFYSSPSPFPSPTPTPTPLSPVCVWNYQNPNTWPSLPCAQSCGGTMQSPVTIASYVSVPSMGPLSFTGYGPTLATLTNKGYTIEVELPESYGAYFKPGFMLKQFHFHTPAENSFQVVESMTMHMVHKNDTGSIAVLTILFDISRMDNPHFSSLIASLPLVNATYSSVALNFSGFSAFLSNMSQSQSDGYVHFVGSLTTPPCTEGVDWYIFIVPQTVSWSQYVALHSLIKYNFRPSQRVLYNVQAYVPQQPAPQPVPSSQQQSNKVDPREASYFNGFWVVLALLIVASVFLGVMLVLWKSKTSAQVTHVQ